MAEAKSTGARLVRPTTNDRGCRWYVAVDGNTSGPFGYEALVEKIQGGQIPFSAHVWRPGFAQWIALGARPDLVAEFPDRPSLGLVPASLEAARMMRTEELSFSQDVIDEQPEPQLPPPMSVSTMDLPRVSTLDAVEAEALSELERARPTSSPSQDPAEALAAGMAAAPASTHIPDEGVLDLAAPPSPSLLEVAERLEVAAPRGSVSEDIILAEMSSGLRRARRVRAGLGLTLLALLVGLGLLVWSVESAQVLPGQLRPGTPPAPASSPERPEAAPPPVVRQARLDWTGTSEPPRPAVAVAGPAALDRASPEAAREAQGESPPLVEATPPSPESELAWLNRKAPTPDPEPMLVNQARSAPRNFRIEAPEPETELTMEVVLPEGLSEERAGQTVAAHLSSFASCARLDRLTDRLPAGTQLELRVGSEGRVSRARANGAPQMIARCLERSARKLSFAPFSRPSERVRVSFARAGTVRTSVLR